MYVASCSKGGNLVVEDSGANHEVVPGDTTAPVIEISTPVPNQIFSNGNILNITGKVTDELGLYRGSITITNDENGAIAKQQLYEIHGLLLYNFSLAYTLTTSIVSNYTVTVLFEDHGNNTVSKSVKIKVNP